MSLELDIFPSEEWGNEPDLLDGAVDMTPGQQATAYFAALEPRDRGIVHAFQANGFHPFGDLNEYIRDLVRGLHERDPLRLSGDAVDATVAEIVRAKRYAELYFDPETTFFPQRVAGIQVEADQDDPHSTHEIEVDAWAGNLVGKSRALGYHDDWVRADLDLAEAFANDPRRLEEYQSIQLALGAWDTKTEPR